MCEPGRLVRNSTRIPCGTCGFPQSWCCEVHMGTVDHLVGPLLPSVLSPLLSPLSPDFSARSSFPLPQPQFSSGHPSKSTLQPMGVTCHSPFLVPKYLSRWPMEYTERELSCSCIQPLTPLLLGSRTRLTFRETWKSIVSIRGCRAEHG